jgi:hypothetical protein
MNPRIGLGLAVVAAALTVYYAFPGFVAILSLGEICPYSPAGTRMCAESAPGEPGSADGSRTSPQPDTAELCKEEGIRYTGTTTEGAEVCFTLTSDRREWVEIGFSFVRASRCPGGATGRTYYEGQEPLTGTGRLTASGFTGTIQGGRASGSLEDSKVCGSKSFKWGAHRSP